MVGDLVSTPTPCPLFLDEAYRQDSTMTEGLVGEKEVE